MPAPQARDFLVFQLYGILAAWGDIAVGERRPARAHPSKSAITGLLGAALGVDRYGQNELHTALNDNYGVAVCMRSAGKTIPDYHTTQAPKGNRYWPTRKAELEHDLSTILSQRDYQVDALYLVAIWQKTPAEYSLEELRAALQRPKYHVSLGRKSCPPCLPFRPEIRKKTTLKNACTTYDTDHIFEHKSLQSQSASWFWEDGLSEEELGMTATLIYSRRDMVRSRDRWQFSNRTEYRHDEDSRGGA